MSDDTPGTGEVLLSPEQNAAPTRCAACGGTNGGHFQNCVRRDGQKDAAPRGHGHITGTADVDTMNAHYATEAPIGGQPVCECHGVVDCPAEAQPAPTTDTPMMVDEDARWIEIQAMSGKIADKDDAPNEVESALCGAVWRAKAFARDLTAAKAEIAELKEAVAIWKGNCNTLGNKLVELRAAQEGMVLVRKDELEAINRDAWSDEKSRMRIIARTSDRMLAASKEGTT